MVSGHAMNRCSAFTRVVLHSDEALRATICPFTTPRGDLVLAALSQGSGPDHEQVERFQQQVSRLV